MVFNAEEFKENLSARLRRQYGKDISQANKHDLFDAVSASALELIMPNWMATASRLRWCWCLLPRLLRFFSQVAALWLATINTSIQPTILTRQLYDI